VPHLAVGIILASKWPKDGIPPHPGSEGWAALARSVHLGVAIGYCPSAGDAMWCRGRYRPLVLSEGEDRALAAQVTGLTRSGTVLPKQWHDQRHTLSKKVRQDGRGQAQAPGVRRGVVSHTPRGGEGRAHQRII
jgi:hypothetical protein